MEILMLKKNWTIIIKQLQYNNTIVNTKIIYEKLKWIRIDKNEY